MPSSIIIILDTAASILGVIAVYSYLRSQSQYSRGLGLPLPPGPRKWPLIGNLFDMPTRFQHRTFTEMGKKYDSDIIHYNVFGTNIMVLNSYEAAKELLENRSAIYSSRPRAPMLRELGGYDFTFGMFPYDSRWRLHRRLFTKYLHPQNIEINEPKEIEYVQGLLKNLLMSPDDFLSHIRQYWASVSLSIIYGLKVVSDNDPFVKITEKAVDTLNVILTPGAFLVDSFPLLKIIPEWFPGAGFQRLAKRSREESKEMQQAPFGAAMDAMRDGTLLPSFISEGLIDMQGKQNIDTSRHIQILKEIAVMSYIGMADTSFITLTTFVLVMMKYPEVQKTAQRELDAVLNGRLPEHCDMPSLPYITALLWEVFRWEAAVPTGLVHYGTEDDFFKGYFIPAGSVIIANQRGMLHDERDYPDPDVFRPERFLKDGQLDTGVRNPEDIAFGFGRRICPGRHLAKSALWITMASILSTFDIGKPTDTDGNIVEPTYEFSGAGISHPEPFACSIKPRSEKTASLLWSLSEA